MVCVKVKKDKYMVENVLVFFLCAKIRNCGKLDIFLLLWKKSKNVTHETNYVEKNEEKTEVICFLVHEKKKMFDSIGVKK